MRKDFHHAPTAIGSRPRQIVTVGIPKDQALEFDWHRGKLCQNRFPRSQGFRHRLPTRQRPLPFVSHPRPRLLVCCKNGQIIQDAGDPSPMP
jgi:hypothetical protein